MATPQSLLTAVGVSLLALTDVDSVSERLNRNRAPIPETEVRANYVGKVIGFLGHSNVLYTAMEILVEVVHNPSSDDRVVDTESVYLVGPMQDIQLSLADPAWWRAVTAVYDVIENPTIEDPIREGRMVVFSAIVQVTVQP